MEQIEKIQGTEKEFIKVFQELCYSRSFMAGVGRSNGGNGLHTGEFG